MTVFRYDTSGRWFKGNTHIHSTASDGGKDFKELAELYGSAGYDFLFRTDHWVLSDVEGDVNHYPLLWMDGVELDGQDHTGAYFHVVCLGKVRNIKREDGFEAGMKAAREQGALVILAHPYWCANTLDDAVRWSFDGIEGYNHVCHWLNGKSGGLVHWDAALMRHSGTLGFAVDDAHLSPEHPGWNGGWIMINAPACTAGAVTDAIRRGNFYSSCGPEIHAITFDGNEVHLETSPIRFARLVGPGASGNRTGTFKGKLMTKTSFSVPQDWRYAYVEVEDQKGRRAWTNPLFVTDRSSNKPGPGEA
jgi:hypothetical protein